MLKIISALFLLISFSACGGTSPSLPSGYTLPPMPDSTSNSATIEGIDSNNNGVRDDVEIYIYTNYSKPEEQRSQMQTARMIQDSLLNIKNKEDAYKWNDIASKAIDCNIKVFGWEYNSLHDVNSQILNTRERIKQQLEVEHILSGGVYEDKKVDNPCE
jgi:hypothetical protein